jgi:hypothetical protein
MASQALGTYKRFGLPSTPIHIGKGFCNGNRLINSLTDTVTALVSRMFFVPVAAAARMAAGAESGNSRLDVRQLQIHHIQPGRQARFVQIDFVNAQISQPRF